MPNTRVKKCSVSFTLDQEVDEVARDIIISILHDAFGKYVTFDHKSIEINNYTTAIKKPK